MDNTTLNAANTADQINIPSGEFRVYGNKPAPSLSNKDFKGNFDA